MLIIHPSSRCDVCLDPFSLDDAFTSPHNPHAIPCGHIFCQSCLLAIPHFICPLCRKRYDPSRTKRIHIYHPSPSITNRETETLMWFFDVLSGTTEPGDAQEEEWKLVQLEEKYPNSDIIDATRSALEHVRRLRNDCHTLNRTTRELQFLHEGELGQIQSLEKQLRANQKRKTRYADYETLLDEQRAKIRELAAQLDSVSRTAEKQRMGASYMQAQLDHHQMFSPPPQLAASSQQRPYSTRPEPARHAEAARHPDPLPPEPVPAPPFQGFSPGVRDPNAPFPFFVPLSITPHPIKPAEPQAVPASSGFLTAIPVTSLLTATHSPPPTPPPAPLLPTSPRDQTPRPVPPPISIQVAAPLYSPQPKLPDSAMNAAVLASRPELDTIAKLKDAQAQLDYLLRPEASAPPPPPPKDHNPNQNAVAGPSTARVPEERKHRKKHKHRRPQSDVVEPTAFPVLSEDTFLQAHAHSEPPNPSASLANPSVSSFENIAVTSEAAGVWPAENVQESEQAAGSSRRKTSSSKDRDNPSVSREMEKLKHRMDKLDRKGKARERHTPAPPPVYERGTPAPVAAPAFDHNTLGFASVRSPPLFERPPVAQTFSPPPPTQDAEDFLHGYAQGYDRGFVTESNAYQPTGSYDARENTSRNHNTAPRAIQASYSMPQYASPRPDVYSPVRPIRYNPTPAPAPVQPVPMLQHEQAEMPSARMLHQPAPSFVNALRKKESVDSLAGALGGTPLAFGGFDAPPPHRRTISDAMYDEQHATSFLPRYPPPNVKPRTTPRPVEGSHRTVYNHVSASDAEPTSSKREKSRRTKTSSSSRSRLAAAASADANALGLDGLRSGGESAGEALQAPKPVKPTAKAFLRSFSQDPRY